MDREVYSLLETQAGLERVAVGSEEPKSFIFCSPEIRNKKRIVILIHGSGVVRAGQWARRLIINEVRSLGTVSWKIQEIFFCRTSLRAPCCLTSNIFIPKAGA